MRHIPLRYSLIWHDYLLAWIIGAFAPLHLWGAFLGLALLLLFDSRLWTIARTLALFALFFSAYAFAYFCLANAEAQKSDTPDWVVRTNSQKPVRICGQIEKTQGLPDQRLRVILGHVRPEEDPNAPNLPGFCSWIWEQPQNVPLPGQTACITKTIRHADGFANGNPDPALPKEIFWRIWSKGEAGSPRIHGQPAFAAYARNCLESRLISLLKGPKELSQSRAILVALLFGDRQFLTQKTAENFARASLAHSLALSGQHLCIAALFGALIVMGLAMRSPSIYLKIPKLYFAAILSIPFAITYLWLGNSPPSLLRSFAMLAIFSIWIWRGKPFGGIDLLCSAVLVILILQPLAIFDFGLQLSILCVAVISLAAPATRSLFNRFAISPWIRYIILIIAISFIIQTALLPLSLQKFQFTSIWFPLNALWLPLLGLIELPFGVVSLILSAIPGCGQLAELCLSIAIMPGELILSLLSLLESHDLLSEPVFLIPHWSALFAFAAIALGLVVIYGSPRPAIASLSSRKFLLVGLLLLSTGPFIRFVDFFNDDLSIEALDVGQGTALLLKFPPAGRIIIDAGGSASRRFDPGKNIIMPILCYNQPPRLAAAINSHPDIDHMGGLIWLMNNLKCGRLFHNGRAAHGSFEEKWRQFTLGNNASALVADDELILGPKDQGLSLKILHPEGKQWQNNAASLIIQLVRNGAGLALFTGDADREALEYLLWTTENIHSQIVIAPHHGSDKSALEGFYERTRPGLVIACCGRENRWGYPGKKLAALLGKMGVPLLDTGNHGRIKINLEKGKISAQRGEKTLTFGNLDKTR